MILTTQKNLTWNLTAVDGKSVLKTSEELAEYAAENWNDLLKVRFNFSDSDDTAEFNEYRVLANFGGWITLMSQHGRILQTWAGELMLA
jgi:hypothetical protein